MVIPVAGVAPRELRDSFRSPRSGGRVHKAIDIFAARGTPVVALTSGEIVRVGVDGLGGNVVRLRSTSGRYEFYYAHLDRFAPGLRIGQTVARGDTLGTVGTTGNARATPPHLHFQMMLRDRDGEGTPLNPYGLLRFLDVSERAAERRACERGSLWRGRRGRHRRQRLAAPLTASGGGVHFGRGWC